MGTRLVVFALDARQVVTGFKLVSVGTQNAALVHPREVFRAALALSAHTIAVAQDDDRG